MFEPRKKGTIFHLELKMKFENEITETIHHDYVKEKYWQHLLCHNGE